MQKTSTTNIYRYELRGRILSTAMVAFRKKGIKAVKMDDIANELSISKRTLYEIYTNKEDLLYECVRDHDEMFEKKLKDMVSERESTVIDILACFMKLHIEEASETNPAFYSELVKYPKLIDYINERNERQRSRSRGFMQRGVEEGFFRSDIDYDITNLMVEVFMSHVMEKGLYKRLPLPEIIRNVVMVMLRGFSTEKGLRRIEMLKL
ncbi:MAG: TetR/AcrR family transcriptional regulator [Prevotella sp.]|nr:TetR/AcrR family transcriptional regulator [Prevotella sp.]